MDRSLMRVVAGIRIRVLTTVVNDIQRDKFLRYTFSKFRILTNLLRYSILRIGFALAL